MKTEEELKNYRREYYREYRKKESWKKYITIHNYAYYADVKTKVLRHYGQVCVTCGEHRFSKLSIDHINNDGGKHRRELKMECGGYNFYLWLIKNNFPPGYQTLCVSCNSRKNALWMKENKIGIFGFEMPKIRKPSRDGVV